MEAIRSISEDLASIQGQPHGEDALIDQIIKLGNLLIDFVKAVAWPAVVAWLVWYLRAELKQAAARIIKIGPAGAELAPPTPEQVAAPPSTTLPRIEGKIDVTEESDRLEASGTVSDSRSMSVELYIAQLKAFVSEDQLVPAIQSVRELLSKFGSDKTKQLEALIHLTAALSVQLGHERNYIMIYGSQLRLLAQMNTDPGVPPNFARAIYDETKAQYQDAYRTITFEQWIGFLMAAGLCNLASSGNYVLTGYGRGFLKYIVDQHYSVNKPL